MFPEHFAWYWYLVAYVIYAVVQGVYAARVDYRSNPATFRYGFVKGVLTYVAVAPFYTLCMTLGFLDWVLGAFENTARFIVTFGNNPKK